MSIPPQTTIDSYLDGHNIPAERREKIILAITDILYERNQNVVKAEKETDQLKLAQYLRSIDEYDAIIGRQITEAVDGHLISDYNYDF